MMSDPRDSPSEEVHPTRPLDPGLAVREWLVSFVANIKPLEAAQ